MKTPYTLPVMEILFYSGRAMFVNNLLPEPVEKCENEIPDPPATSNPSSPLSQMQEEDQIWLQRSSNIKLLYQNCEFTKLIEQLTYIKQDIDNSDGSEFNTISCLNNLGVIHCEMGDFGKGKDFLNQAKENQACDENDTLKGILVNNFSYIEFRLSQYDKALELLGVSLELKREGAYQIVQESLANSLYNRGVVHFKLAYYFQSLDSLNDALFFYNKAYDEKHWLTAMTECLIAMNEKTVGRHKQALELCLNAIDVLKDEFSDEHPEVASAYYTLGTIYFSMGDYENALKIHEKSYKIREKVYGRNNQMTAFSVHSIGNIYHLRNQSKEAIENYEIALNIRLGVFGEENIDVGVTYSDIGQVYSKMKAYPNAIKFLESALSIFKKFFREDHPDIGTCYNNLGMIYEDIHEPEKALRYLQMSLKIYEKISGIFLPIMAINLNNIGSVYYSLGDLSKAVQAFEDSIKILKKSFDQGHPDIALGFGNLGFIYEDMKDYHHSILNYVKSIRHTLQIGNREETRISSLFRRTSSIYEEVRDLPRALGVLKKAHLFERKSIGDEGKRDLLEVKNEIMEIEKQRARTQKNRRFRHLLMFGEREGRNVIMR